jgi:hypothetical protein
LAVSDAGGAIVPRKIIEVQGREEIEWVAHVTVDVPEAVLQLDDPDGLAQWVELNVDAENIKEARQVVTSKVEQTGADIVTG